MGILAGILKKVDQAQARFDLDRMVTVQRHRDPSGAMSSLVTEGLALGGVNHFDDDFEENSPTFSHNITAWVDGLVLPAGRRRARDAVAQAYLEHGLDFMAHVDGEFTACVWDGRSRRLILARDPFGHKPLHYFLRHREVYFSSEIKGLLAVSVPAVMDMVNLSDFLTLNCVPYPATIFKDIYQVPPGGMVIVDGQGLKVKKWWSPDIAIDDSVTFAEACEVFSEKFIQALKKRVFGKKAYCFLSGGMDSSAIASWASDLTGGALQTVSIGFAEQAENELEDAEIMARHVGAEHHPLIVKPDSFFALLDTLVFHHDSPFTDTSAYPTYFAAQAGAGLTDVILTGDGPDQVLGGSDHYVFAYENNIFSPRDRNKQLVSAMAARLLGKLTSDPTPCFCNRAARKFYRESLSPVQAAYDLRSYFPDLVKRYLCTDDLWQIHQNHNPYRHPEQWFQTATGLDNINRYLYADLEFYLPDDLMIKVDRMCMAHGLETLSPFLDRDLAAYLLRLPGSFKINRKGTKTVTKFLLQEICRSRFPRSILNKKKQGFGIPLEAWLRQDNGKQTKEILLDSRALGRSYFRKESIENLIKVFFSGRGDYFYPAASALAGLLTLELWQRQYIDGAGG